MAEQDDEPSDLIRRKSEKLAETGYQHLRDEDADAALKVAAELEALRYTAAFEIAALAHAQLGDLEAAVAVLRRGLDLAPTVWANWQLFGNYLSDLERYEEAEAAYEKALGCPGVGTSSVRLNQAILASRRGLHEQALSYADQVVEPDLAMRTTSARVTALVGVGRFDEALRLGEPILAEGDSDDPVELAYLAESLAGARKARGATDDEIFAFALEALDAYDRNNRELLALIRRTDDQYSPNAKYFRMTVDAKIPFTDPLSREGKGYVVNYDVVADSVEEALSYVERMEAPAVRGNLLVDEHEVLEDRPGGRKGVYKRTDRFFYEVED